MRPSPEARVFRPGATVPVFFVWAGLTGAVAGFLIQHAVAQPNGSESKSLAYLMGSVGILIGPLPFVIHFLRLCLVWVSVEKEGLLLRSGRMIPWGEVRSVELKESAFKGFIRADPLIFFLTVGCYAVLIYVVFPSIALLTPWHQRVILILGSGEKVVFRDLMNAPGFVQEVRRRSPAA
jgi:hypothetical protein